MLRLRAPIVHLIALIAVVGIGAGCASEKRYTKPKPRPVRLTRIEVGMTKAEVESVLGRPHEYAGTGAQETWRYHKRDGEVVVSMTVVRFNEGVVQSFDTDVKPLRPAPVGRPELRPAPGPSPHHGQQPPRSHAPPGAVAPPPSGHGDSGGPSLRDSIKLCTSDRDCPSGQRCTQRGDGSKVCK